ncbi:MAG: RNA-binding S4 domain-containing protein [Bacteroidales bacterium]
MAEGVRIDKLLWSVRVFKTRSLASDACRSGKVMVNDSAAKPSREVQPGDVIVINLGAYHKTLKVKEPLKNRVAARLVPEYVDDLTPESEYDKLKITREANYEFRTAGLGRPTKKERRMIEKLKKSRF